jgi:hypothetical protein
MEILSNLPLTGIIKNHYTAEVIKQTIMDRIQHIPNLTTLKGTVQLISLICNMDLERGIAGKNIEYLIDSKAINDQAT